MSEASPLTFAMISSAPAAAALLEAVCDELTKRTSQPFSPRVLRTYDKLLDAMREGEIDLAWAPPLVAIDLERADAAKIRLCSRRAGKRDYSCAVFARAETVTSLDNLTGKRMAWVAKESAAGYVVPRLRLIVEGYDPDETFSEQTFRRTHEAVARAVITGDADVGATYVSFLEGKDEPVSAGWFEAGATNEDIIILATAGPIPTDVIAISTRLDGSKAAIVTDAMRELGEPIRQLLNADGFDQPEASHFDELRRLVESAQAKPA
jgi:phosphate/phosphite/phosphonate ABC transporter binding protein